jgi:hypothetical protein
MDVSMPFCDDYEWGLFGGYAHSLGASKTILPDVVDENGVIIDQRNFGLGTKVKAAARLSPRLVWTCGPIKVAGEMEWTRAWHGTPNAKGIIHEATATDNLRFLLALFYYF